MRARLALTLALAAFLSGCGSGVQPEIAGSGSTPATTEETGSQEAPPEPVERTRRILVAAAAEGNYATLAAQIPEEGFTYTYGGPFPGGPIAYWKQVASEHDPSPLAVLEALLAMPYTKVGDKYVWPFAYDRDPASLTDDELDMLARVASPEELRLWKQSGHYLGWRAGVHSDGTWVFFVAGD